MLGHFRGALLAYALSHFEYSWSVTVKRREHYGYGARNSPANQIQLIFGKETICINYSLTARRHVLNQCLKLRPSYIITHNFMKGYIEGNSS